MKTSPFDGQSTCLFTRLHEYMNVTSSVMFNHPHSSHCTAARRLSHLVDYYKTHWRAAQNTDIQLCMTAFIFISALMLTFLHDRRDTQLYFHSKMQGLMSLFEPAMIKSKAFSFEEQLRINNRNQLILLKTRPDYCLVIICECQKDIWQEKHYKNVSLNFPAPSWNLSICYYEKTRRQQHLVLNLLIIDLGPGLLRFINCH